MVMRWACYGFVQKVLWLVAARVAMGFFAVLGVGFLDNIKKGVFAYVYALKLQSHAIPFQAAFSNKAAIFLYSGASLSSSMK